MLSRSYSKESTKLVPGLLSVCCCGLQVFGIPTVPPVGRDSIWSASKIVSAAMAMRMVEAGTLDLDTPISVYLDWWTTDPRDPRAAVTLRHLLSQVRFFFRPR